VTVAGKVALERTMTDQDFTTTFTVDQTPEEVFAAINDVRGWWTGEIEGSTDKVGDEFTYRYEDLHHSRQRIIELVPGASVVWHVLDASLSFVKNKTEWKGTDIVFSIGRTGDQTVVRFTHVGLVPNVECFDACSNGWDFFVGGSLRNLITGDTDLASFGASLGR
jgi:Activator of Hsp90 ATPase homolog 1-like protein